MLLNRILQTSRECFACTFSSSWTTHYNKNLFEHFGCLMQCLYSVSFKYQTAWLLMEILISVDCNGLSKCPQFCKIICVNRKQEIECGSSWEGGGAVCRAARWLSPGNADWWSWAGGDYGIIEPSHCKGIVRKKSLLYMSGNEMVQRQFAEQMLYSVQFHLFIMLSDILTAIAYRVCSVGWLTSI